MGSNNSVVFRHPKVRGIRVLIADPYPVVLHGFRKMIEDHGRFQVVAAVSTMPAFWKAEAAERPDVVLLDWSMAAQDSAVTTGLLQSGCHPPIIFLSKNSEEERDMRRSGVRIVLSKGCSAEEIMTAIAKASSKLLPQEPGEKSSSQDMISPSLAQDPVQRISQLTKREMQLLPLVCRGMKNKEIAISLGIAESTVWHHLTSVFTKLGVEDRLGLATFAYRHKLVPAYDEPLPFRTVQPV